MSPATVPIDPAVLEVWTLYAALAPISQKWVPEALRVSGFSREDTLKFADPAAEMLRFETWLKDNVQGRPIFVADNNGFDWQFVNWYFHHFLARNPFGFSSMNLNPLYKGIVRDTSASFKHLRKTRHTHHPVDDAMGNAEALLQMQQALGLKIKL